MIVTGSQLGRSSVKNDGRMLRSRRMEIPPDCPSSVNRGRAKKRGISCGRSWSHALDVSSGWEISIENAQSGDGKSTIFFLMEPTNEKRVKQFLGATQEETTRKRNNFSVLRLHMRHENFTVPALTMCMTS